MAGTLSLISTVAFIIAAFCLVITITIFIRFKIPSIIGDLSGRNARKSIELMRERNVKSARKSVKMDNGGPKTALLNDENATTALVDDKKTTALEDCHEPVEKCTEGISIEILEEVMLIHTKEIIDNLIQKENGK